MSRRIIISICISLIAVTTVALVSIYPSQATSSANCKSTDAFCYAPQVVTKLDRLDSVQLPKIATPSWMTTQSTTSAARQVTYTVATRGSLSADVNEFASDVNQTLNSPLGWSRLGVQFAQIESGGEFTVWLSEASQMTTFSASGCDTIVSCTVGNDVIINQTRWLNGSDAWNAAGGSIADYRKMVVNHEAGHWLGHGHEFCSEAGQPAPVMQQQTINMQGCAPNPWPLANEIYAPKLGIRS